MYKTKCDAPKQSAVNAGEARKGLSIQDELNIIADRSKGILRPADVVEYARVNTDSTLHRQFTWDDSAAAHQWRLQQARNIINVSVTVMAVNNEEVTVRAFFSLPSKRSPDSADAGYRRTTDILKNKTMRSELLEMAVDDMNRFSEKYKTLHEISSVITEMKRVQKKIDDAGCARPIVSRRIQPC